MLTKRLEMIFQNASGRNVTVAVVEPKTGLTAAEVQAAMQVIVAQNIFQSTGGDLVSIVSARTVTRDTTEILTA